MTGREATTITPCPAAQTSRPPAAGPVLLFRAASARTAVSRNRINYDSSTRDLARNFRKKLVFMAHFRN